MVLIVVSSASPVLQRLCSQQPNSTGLSPAMRRPCKDGTSYIVTGCDWYVRLHGNIHSKPKVPSWMPNEHYFSLGAGAQVWPISHSPFSWYVHLLMSCQMVGFLLMWQHAGSSVLAYMALRTPRVYGTRSGLELAHICCYDPPYPLGLWFMCIMSDLCPAMPRWHCIVSYWHFAKPVSGWKLAGRHIWPHDFFLIFFSKKYQNLTFTSLMIILNVWNSLLGVNDHHFNFPGIKFWPFSYRDFCGKKGRKQKNGRNLLVF